MSKHWKTKTWVLPSLLWNAPQNDLDNSTLATAVDLSQDWNEKWFPVRLGIDGRLMCIQQVSLSLERSVYFRDEKSVFPCGRFVTIICRYNTKLFYLDDLKFLFRLSPTIREIPWIYNTAESAEASWGSVFEEALEKLEK